ncbi:hypothetical protein P8452_58855 [Trifolium repens]|nr:hypothetical protein P8452_58855 [Trifolium repens]
MLLGRGFCSKPIIRPIGNGFTPANVAAAAVRRVIQTTFPDNISRYSELKEEERKSWFKKFANFVSWEQNFEEKIERNFHIACGKRLRDFLNRARNKNGKPTWMSQTGWKFLILRWAEDDFKKLSQQNRINRASKKGGSLHSSGNIAHHEIALNLSLKFDRSVDPDELFRVTHKKKTGDWVDFRSETTHDNYLGHLTQLTQEVDGFKKIEIWKKVAGGMYRGRCYGTGLLAPNITEKSNALVVQEVRFIIF